MLNNENMPLLLCAENPSGYTTMIDWLYDTTPVLVVEPTEEETLTRMMQALARMGEDE